jgi:hypothetical protein
MSEIAEQSRTAKKPTPRDMLRGVADAAPKCRPNKTHQAQHLFQGLRNNSPPHELGSKFRLTGLLKNLNPY